MLHENSTIDRSTLGFHSLQHYEPIIGTEAVERITKKVDRVRTMRVAHISSTFYGGGVTEILTPLTLMMNATGIETASRVCGSPFEAPLSPFRVPRIAQKRSAASAVDIVLKAGGADGQQSRYVDVTQADRRHGRSISGVARFLNSERK